MQGGQAAGEAEAGAKGGHSGVGTLGSGAGDLVHAGVTSGVPRPPSAQAAYVEGKNKWPK